MGYTTDFEGAFKLDRALAPEHAKYLTAFAQTRRMRRVPAVASTLPDPIRMAAGLPVGIEGGYYVGGYGKNYGQARDASVVDHNKPPADQPALWCQWTPNEDGTAIIWDGGEKFCNYVEWISYLIENFLEPWGYKLNGEVKWSGEERGDLGAITVKDNQVTVRKLEATSASQRVVDAAKIWYASRKSPSFSVQVAAKSGLEAAVQALLNGDEEDEDDE